MMCLCTTQEKRWKQEGRIVKLRERGAPSAAWAKQALLPSVSGLTLLGRFVKKARAIAAMEVRKLRHDPTERFTRAVQPALGC